MNSSSKNPTEMDSVRTDTSLQPKAHPLPSPYLTCEEAAAYLRTTKQGIYSLVKNGRLHSMPGRRRLLFTCDALDRCLTTRRH